MMYWLGRSFFDLGCRAYLICRQIHDVASLTGKEGGNSKCLATPTRESIFVRDLDHTRQAREKPTTWMPTNLWYVRTSVQTEETPMPFGRPKAFGHTPSAMTL
jgi:hypothetical protein